MGLYLIIISVRINGNSNMNLILAVILNKILMILICKPLIFKNIFDSLQEIIRKVQKTKRIEHLLNKCRDHLKGWIGPTNNILQTKYIPISSFYLSQAEHRPLSQLRVMRDVQASLKKRLETNSVRCAKSQIIVV